MQAIRIRACEALQAGAAREVLEETGMRVTATDLLDVTEVIAPEREWRVVILPREQCKNQRKNPQRNPQPTSRALHPKSVTRHGLRNR
jgi:ADP-ribose pyrophosphatase YjhB (NUDIX family)